MPQKGKSLAPIFRYSFLYRNNLKASSGGLGRCPKNLQGTSPLTHNRALPEPALPGAEGREELPSFLEKRSPDNAPAPWRVCVSTGDIFPYQRFYCPLYGRIPVVFILLYPGQNILVCLIVQLQLDLDSIPFIIPVLGVIFSSIKHIRLLSVGVHLSPDIGVHLCLYWLIGAVFLHT